MKKTVSAKPELSKQQKLIFKLVMLVIPVIIFFAFEGMLRLVGYGDNLDLFIENPTEGYEDYMIVNPLVGKKYFQKFEYTAPANDIFLKEKDEKVFRVFVMGSSTVFGFPYDRNIMFSRILDHRLKEAYGYSKVEVVNTAITAINSFTLLDYAKQIKKHKPDAVLIYAGHNEFYGAFGIGSNETMSKNRTLTKMHVQLMNLRLYQLIRNSIAGVAQKMASSKNKVHGTLMKRIVANKDILLDSDDYAIAMERYEQNMDELLSIFSTEKIPIFYSQIVSNVKDIKPFNSIKTNNLESASEVYNKAVEFEAKGDYKQAQNYYYKAKDLDCIRFRASEELNAIIEKLAQTHSATLVPMQTEFQNASPNGLVGNNLMTEHVHPNIDGNFLMADVFFYHLFQSELIGTKNNVSLSSFKYFKNNYGYSILDSLNAIHNVEQLKSYWPFVKDNNGKTDYLRMYQPKSYIDSAVFSALKYKEVTLSNVRLELAEMYEQNKMYDKAVKEYQALLCANPYLAINYRDVARNLIYLGDLPLALDYFKKSLAFEDNFYAAYKAGEICLMKADYNQAVKYFEKAYVKAPAKNKVNILLKSYMALVYGNRLADANKVKSELEKANASKALQIPPKQYIYENYIPYKTKTEVLQAKDFIAKGDDASALNILENSLNIYNSHIANRLLGEIYYRLKDFKQSDEYFMKVYHEFEFDPTFLHQLIVVKAITGNFIDAKKMRDELNKLSPDYNKIKEVNALNLN